VPLVGRPLFVQSFWIWFGTACSDELVDISTTASGGENGQSTLGQPICVSAYLNTFADVLANIFSATLSANLVVT